MSELYLGKYPQNYPEQSNIIDIICISNNSGFYQLLKIGKWYKAEENNTYFLIGGIPYDKNLFKTKKEWRNYKISKINK
jgi:hypothetical protein